MWYTLTRIGGKVTSSSRKYQYFHLDYHQNLELGLGVYDETTIGTKNKWKQKILNILGKLKNKIITGGKKSKQWAGGAKVEVYQLVVKIWVFFLFNHMQRVTHCFIHFAEHWIQISFQFSNWTNRWPPKASNRGFLYLITYVYTKCGILFQIFCGAPSTSFLSVFWLVSSCGPNVL